MTTVFKIILPTVFAACLPMMTLSCTKTSKSKVASATQRKKQKLPSHITETLNASRRKLSTGFKKPLLKPTGNLKCSALIHVMVFVL